MFPIGVCVWGGGVALAQLLFSLSHWLGAVPRKQSQDTNTAMEFGAQRLGLWSITLPEVECL